MIWVYIATTVVLLGLTDIRDGCCPWSLARWPDETSLVCELHRAAMLSMSQLIAIGGPLFGRFGDLFGARAALTVALFSSFLTYAILAISSNIPMLFLSRIPGVLMHVMHGKCDCEYSDCTIRVYYRSSNGCY